MIGFCSAAGQPCQGSRCHVPKDPPPLPPGWTSLAKVGDVPRGMLQVEWKSEPIPLAQWWSLTKDGRAICQLLYHPFGSPQEINTLQVIRNRPEGVKAALRRRK